jgi:hypothetical protein
LRRSRSHWLESMAVNTYLYPRRHIIIIICTFTARLDFPLPSDRSKQDNFAGFQQSTTMLASVEFVAVMMLLSLTGISKAFCTPTLHLLPSMHCDLKNKCGMMGHL